MQTIKWKEQPGFRTFTLRCVYRVLYFFCHCRVTYPPDLKDSEDPVVFVANHYNVFGPMGFILSVPFLYDVWVNKYLMDPETARKNIRPGVKRLLPFAGDKIIDWLSVKLGNLSCSWLKRFGAIPVDRDNPKTIISTMRESIKSLQGGKSLLVFPETGLPEYSLTSVTPFFSAFATVGGFYYRKTGKNLKFCPCYVDQQHHMIRIGEPIEYRGGGTDINTEAERVSEELNAKIREMAAVSRGVKREEDKPAKRTVLFFCNLVRFFLLIPLGILLYNDQRLAGLIIYLVGQGIRILFEAITSRNRPASNYVSTFFSHVMAVGADIIMLANLAEVDRLLLFPLYALVFNAVVISVSNIVTFSKARGWAGSNYFDSLSSNAIALLCLLQFLRVPLKRLFRNVVVVGACLFLVISAGCCVAFNIRFSQKEAV